MTSLRTPPVTPVIVPISTTMSGGHCAASANWAPDSANSANPSASATSSVAPGGGHTRTYATVASADATMTTRYQVSVTQKIGWRSRRRSRSVPPPMAVIAATTITPSRSRSRSRAASTPLAANTATPARSK